MSSSQVVHAAETYVVAIIGARPTRVSQPYDQSHRLASSEFLTQFPALVKNLRSRLALGQWTVCNLVQSEGTSDALNSVDGVSFFPGHAGKGSERLTINLATASWKSSVKEVFYRSRHIAEVGW